MDFGPWIIDFGPSPHPEEKRNNNNNGNSNSNSRDDNKTSYNKFKIFKAIKFST